MLHEFWEWSRKAKDAEERGQVWLWHPLVVKKGAMWSAQMEGCPYAEHRVTLCNNGRESWGPNTGRVGAFRRTGGSIGPSLPTCKAERRLAGFRDCPHPVLKPSFWLHLLGLYKVSIQSYSHSHLLRTVTPFLLALLRQPSLFWRFIQTLSTPLASSPQLLGAHPWPLQPPSSPSLTHVPRSYQSKPLEPHLHVT